MRAVNTSVIYQHLSEELSGKVIYDDPSVFHRLRVFDEDAAIIACCHKSYQTDMRSNIDELNRIANDASKESDGVEPEDYELVSSMYKPLVCSFQLNVAAANFSSSLGASRRTTYSHIYASGEMVVQAQDAHSDSLPPS